MSLAECREIAAHLRARGLDAFADGQPACACCPGEVWTVVVDGCVFTDEEGEWWGADVRAGREAAVGVAFGAPAAEVAEAIVRAAGGFVRVGGQQ